MFRHTCIILLIVFQLKIGLSQIVLSPPVVELSHGGSLLGTYLYSVQGRVIDSYLGIRYARPPTGSLRFADPKPAPTWSGVKDAKTKSEPCFQFDVTSLDKTPFGAEDCLFLNVFIPRDRLVSGGLPVMVWFHGGAYFFGSSDPVLYGPERLLDHDVILVTLNYRLGAMGFLSTQTSHSPGNYGLKDQLLALKWIREHISNFGGNPQDVTLFGQDAGSVSVSLHMVSAASEGLFHKAILQSGNYFDKWGMIRPSKAVSRAKQLAEIVGCPLPIDDDYTATISCLRKTSPEEIVSALEKIFIPPTYEPATIFGPLAEPSGPNAFLDQDPRDIKKSHGDDIPIIIGATTGEGLGRSAAIIHQFSDEVKRNFNTFLPITLFYDHKSRSTQERITRKIKRRYFKRGLEWSRRNHHNLTLMYSDRFVYSGMESFLRKRLLTGNRYSGDTYVYIFDHNPPKSATEMYGGGPKYYGVCHGDDLPFLFPNGQLGFKSQKRDRQMHWALPKLWTDFVKYSNPTPSDTIITQKWRRATSYPFRYVRIGTQYRSKKRSLQIEETSDDNGTMPETKASSFSQDATEPLDLGSATPAAVEEASTNSSLLLENVRQTEEIFDFEDDDDPDEGLEYHSKGPLMQVSNSTKALSNVTAPILRSNAYGCYLYSLRDPCAILDNKRDRFWGGFYY